MPGKKIAIATPFYNHQGWSDYIQSLFETVWFLAKTTSVELNLWTVPGDSYVWRARNSLARMLMESDYHEILFIDSDMQWGVEGLANLLMRDAPVVGAAYKAKNGWDSWTCHPDAKNVAIDGTLSADMGVVSTGFCKVRRDAFETLAAKFPEDYYHSLQPDGRNVKEFNFFGHIFESKLPYGEDVSFCLRCRKAGIPLVIEPDVTLTHWGVNGWSGNYKEEMERKNASKKQEATANVRDDGGREDKKAQGNEDGGCEEVCKNENQRVADKGEGKSQGKEKEIT